MAIEAAKKRLNEEQLFGDCASDRIESIDVPPSTKTSGL